MEEIEGMEAQNKMNKRYIGAIVLAPLLIFIFIGGLPLKILMMLLALIGMYEFYSAVKNKNINTINIVGYLIAILYYILLNNNMSFKYIIFIFTLLLIMLCIPIFNLNYNFIDTSVTMLGFIYIAVFFSFVVLVDTKKMVMNDIVINSGKYFVWLIFICSWTCDTAAYYSGKFLGKGGKHKLSPKISPNKTVEGSIGGLLGSTIASTVFGYLINIYGFNFNMLHINILNYALIGLICGAFSQLGDLSASAIKRYVDKKDYGNLIPGHGGYLIVLTAFYFLLLWYIFI